MSDGTTQKSKSWWGWMGGALAAVVLSGPAHAETAVAGADANPHVIEEIMVTARRVTEDQQKVPIAVTALTPTMLEQQNIVRSTDLMYAVPSLTVAPFFSTLSNRFAIRGLPTGVTTYMAESPCCIGNPSMAFLDIQSVQVLNGPQGTLFGRTSGAGAVLIEPVRPILNETEGSLKVRLGNYERQEFTGTVNVPIIEDRLAIRLAANSMDVEGYTDQIGSSKKLDGQKNQQVRLGIQFNNGRFSNYTAGGYIHVNQTPTNTVLSGINLNVFPYNLPPAFAPFVYGAAGGGPCIGAVALGLNPDDASCVAERVEIVNGITAALIAENARIQTGGDSAIRHQPAAKPGLDTFMKLKDWNILNVAKFDDMELGRVKVSVKDVFSYESSEDNAGSPADGVGGMVYTNAAWTSGTVGGSSAGRNNTQNAKLVARTGPATEVINNDLNVNFDLDDGLLVTTLGFYYSRADAPRSNSGTNLIAQLWSGVLKPDLGFDSFANFNHDTERTQRAWYTQSTLDASSFGVNGLTFTAGYRKSWDKASVSGHPAVYDLATGSFFPGPTLIETNTKSDGYNYLFTLAEQFTDNFMAYVSHARAYVPGGLNQIVTQGVENLPNYKPAYGPEIVKSWEAGAKIDFQLGENVPVRLNAAVYHYSFDDILTTLSGNLGGTVFKYTANAAKAELKGFEASGAIKPIEGLEIGFSYNYNDAKYTKWIASDPYDVIGIGNPLCGPTSIPGVNCLIDLSNNPFAYMPKHQGHVTVAYSLPFDESLGRVTLSANVYAQSGVWFDSTTASLIEYLPTAKPMVFQESYTTLNLRADWADVIGSGFDAALFVNNATDEVYALSKVQALQSIGFAAATYAAPRMWGLEVSKNF